jgi:hypothetical protein
MLEMGKDHISSVTPQCLGDSKVGRVVIPVLLFINGKGKR